MLHSLGVLVYSPPLDNAIRTQQELSAGHSWEVQLRGCSIWYETRNQDSPHGKLTQAFLHCRAVELIRREILRRDPSATVNAVLIDFFLYDLAKEREAAGESSQHLPHEWSSLRRSARKATCPASRPGNPLFWVEQAPTHESQAMWNRGGDRRPHGAGPRALANTGFVKRRTPLPPAPPHAVDLVLMNEGPARRELTPYLRQK